MLSLQVQLVAVCTMLITVTSMVANDYFDYRIGTDSPDLDEGNVLSQGQLTLEEAKALVQQLTLGVAALPLTVGQKRRRRHLACARHERERYSRLTTFFYKFK